MCTIHWVKYHRLGPSAIVRFGDRRQGSPGMRLQTFCEFTFEFRVLVDAIATYNYVELPEQPTIAIVPGPPVLFKAILPTLRRCGEPFRLCLKGEDRWGNPSDLCDQVFTLQANLPVAGLPDSVRFEKGQFGLICDDLSVAQNGDLVISLVDENMGDWPAHSSLRSTSPVPMSTRQTESASVC